MICVTGRIEFVNHSSLLVTYDDYQILTDPWPISPAFGAWTQMPGPSDALIRTINMHDPDKRIVVISHGHDDHLDEMWMSTNLRGSHFIVPRVPNRGLSRRVERVVGYPPHEIYEGGLNFRGFRFSRFQNPLFTDSDSLVLIQTPDFNVLHANDNWHTYSAGMATTINQELKLNPDALSLYFVQFGIADCFPICHVPFENDERLKVINQRFEEFANSTQMNLDRLNCSSGFYYANQSQFETPPYWTRGSTYELAQEFLARRGSSFVQLLPGTSIDSSGSLNLPSASTPLLEASLQRLETFLNASLPGGLPIRLTISAKLDESTSTDFPENDREVVELLASRIIWSRILNGELTLEAVIIGGAGMVKRPSESISQTHRALSSLSYSVQSRIRKFGLAAF
jgi:hypothetical protein